MFSIVIFVLMVLSPLLIPTAVTVSGAITQARQRRQGQIAASLGGSVGFVAG